MKHTTRERTDYIDRMIDREKMRETWNEFYLLYGWKRENGVLYYKDHLERWEKAPNWIADPKPSRRSNFWPNWSFLG